MTIKYEKSIEVLMPHYLGQSHKEADKATLVLRKALSDSNFYSSISDHPDYLVYASAELLKIALPLMIDEMLSRNDIDNFISYHMIAAVDPDGSGSELYSERTRALILQIDPMTIEKILAFLAAIKATSAFSNMRIDNIVLFWERMRTCQLS